MSILSLKNQCINKIIKLPEFYGQHAKKTLIYDHQLTVDELCLRKAQAHLFPPSKEALGSNLYAVHATDILPTNKTLKAGSRIYDANTGLTLYFFTTRKTVHFALGHLVQAHVSSEGSENSWEERKFALLCPLKDVSLIHLFLEDSFSLGDVSLSDDLIVVTKKENHLKVLQAGFKDKQIALFDKQIDLRTAVKYTIEYAQKWHVSTKKNPKTGMYARLEKGPYRFFDLGSFYFYSSFFDKRIPSPPSFGFPALNSCGEGFGGLFKTFELQLLGFATNFYQLSRLIPSVEIPTDEILEFYLKVIPEILSWEEFAAFADSNQSQESYNDWLSWVYYTLVLMSHDATLRKSHGCSFAVAYAKTYPLELLQWRTALFITVMQTPLSEKHRLLEQSFLRENQKQLTEIVKKNLKLNTFIIPAKTPPTNEKYLMSGITFLQAMPRKCVDRYLSQLVHIEEPESKGSKESLILCLKLYYLISHYFLTLDESFLKEIDTVLSTLQKKFSLDSELDVLSFMNLYHPPLDSLFCNLISRVDPTANLAPIAKNFGAYLGINMQSSCPIDEAHKQPKVSIAKLESYLQKSYKSRDLWEIMSIFTFVFKDIDRVSRVFGISWEEVLIHWKYGRTQYFLSLTELMEKIPDKNNDEHVKKFKTKWKTLVQTAEDRVKSPLKKPGRVQFREALRAGSQLKLLAIGDMNFS